MNLQKAAISMSKILLLVLTAVIYLSACGGKSAQTKYHDPEMDFSTLRTAAVMPLSNLSQDQLAADRVRDTFINKLMATGVLYVIPIGEVARAIQQTQLVDPSAPSTEEINKITAILQADAVFTGSVLEYGEVRSGATSANVISVSMEMFEARSQKVVWVASSTQGGISMADRLLGSGGQPMNEVTQAAVDDLVNKLLY
jgi:hypothetical protein